MRAMIKYLASSAVILGALGAGAAHAAEDPIIFSGGVTFVTDYRLRGASLSDNKPVIQGVIQAEVPLSEGFSLYGGIWASSLDKNAGAGAMETDFYGGIIAKFGQATVKARYLRLVFHDINNLDFDQFEGGVSVPVGPVGLGAGIVHDEYNGGGHSTYVYSSASYKVPDTGFGVKALLGYEDGTGWNDKVNWNLGASYSWKAVTLGVDYIDTNRFSANSRGGNRAKGAVVFSLSAGF